MLRSAPECFRPLRSTSKKHRATDTSPRRPLRPLPASTRPTRARTERERSANAALDSASLTHRSLPRHSLPSLSAPRPHCSWTLLWTPRLDFARELPTLASATTTTQPKAKSTVSRVPRSSGGPAPDVHGETYLDDSSASKLAERARSKRGSMTRSTAFSAKNFDGHSAMRMSEQEFQKFMYFQILKEKQNSQGLGGKYSVFDHNGGSFSALHGHASHQLGLMLKNRRNSASMQSVPSSHGIEGLGIGNCVCSLDVSHFPPPPHLLLTTALYSPYTPTCCRR